jgi:outer membrane protein TolC
MEKRRRHAWLGRACATPDGRRHRPRGRAFLVLACGLNFLLPGVVWCETLTVDDCVRLALARSPAARAAAFDVAAADARVRAARAAYAPRLLAQGDYGRSEGFDETVTNGGLTDALVTFELTVLDGGLRNAQFAAARARLRSAAALEQQRQADVVLAVRSGYFAALAAGAEAAIQGDKLRVLHDSVALLRRQEALGLVPHNDVLRAELEVETAHAAERQAAADLAAHTAELTALTGTSVTGTSIAEPVAMPVVEVMDEMIDASPVMVDARAAADAADREVAAARSEGRGHVTLTANAGALGVQPGPTFHDNGGGQFLLGVTVPLYDGGAVAARVAAATAAANSARAQVNEVRQMLVIALARVAADAQRAQADVSAWQRAVPQAAENFQLMRARYVGGGTVRLLEVLDALGQYVDARLSIPRAQHSYRTAVATQEQMLGKGPP